MPSVRSAVRLLRREGAGAVVLAGERRVPEGVRRRGFPVLRRLVTPLRQRRPSSSTLLLTAVLLARRTGRPAEARILLAQREATEGSGRAHLDALHEQEVARQRERRRRAKERARERERQRRDAERRRREQERLRRIEQRRRREQEEARRADVTRRYERGRDTWRAGDYTEALRELREPELAGVEPAQRLGARVLADVTAREPGWAPAAPPALLPASGGPVPGRILHLVVNSLPQTLAGYNVRTQSVATAQRAAGLDPRVVTRPGFPWDDGHDDATERDEVDGITYHHVRSDQQGIGTADRIEEMVVSTAPLVATQRPAAIQSTTPFEHGRAARALASAVGVPMVYEVRGFLEASWLAGTPSATEDTERYRLSRDAEGATAAAADHVVTLGAWMRDDLVARGVPAERITVIPNAVDVQRFSPSGIGGEVKRQLGIDPATVTVGYVTTVRAYEGVDVLLRAVAALRAGGHDVHALIVGDGPALTELRELADELGLVSDDAPGVTFTGKVSHDEIVAHYEAIDVFVVPRHDLTVTRSVTPLKPLEAMAMRRALVVSDLPALTETITESETGLTFAAGDAHALADTLAPLVDDPERRASLGEAAREWVAAERTWAANGQRYLDVFTQLGAV